MFSQRTFQAFIYVNVEAFGDSLTGSLPPSVLEQFRPAVPFNLGPANGLPDRFFLRPEAPRWTLLPVLSTGIGMSLQSVGPPAPATAHALVWGLHPEL